MVTFALPIMDFDDCRTYMDDLYSSDRNQALSALVRLKNTVIGSNRQKANAISQGLLPRLMRIGGDSDLPIELRNQAIIIIGSLAKGAECQIRELIKADVVPLLLNCLLPQEDNKFSENCLRCLCTIFKFDFAPVHLVFENNALLSRMLNLLMYSVSCQVAVTTILSVSLKTPEHQDMLWNEGAVFSLAALLDSPHEIVLLPTLKCISSLCYKNRSVASSIISASFGGRSMTDLLVALMSRNRPFEMQLHAAKCVTYLFRCDTISSDDSRIVYKALPVLVCLCQSSLPWDTRVDAAETLAYLIETASDLQKLAAISNHLVVVLTGFVNFKGDSSLSVLRNEEIRTNLLQAGFKVFAALAANEEQVRKKIIESDNIAEHIVKSLDHADVKVRLSAVRCLHSLSRSVQQLRTTFQYMCANQEHNVWKPLLRLLENDTDDMLILVSSTLCNLLLEFSPAKEPIMESGAIDLLCNLLNRDDPVLRLNGIWALMNMAFQTDHKVKTLILNTVSMQRINTLMTDNDESILIKTLGLLRNVISPKSQIDYVMSLHGPDIIKICKMVLGGSYSPLVMEQSICVLANVADGDNAKDMIMNDEELVTKLRDYTVTNSHTDNLFCKKIDTLLSSR